MSNTVSGAEITDAYDLIQEFLGLNPTSADREAIPTWDEALKASALSSWTSFMAENGQMLQDISTVLRGPSHGDLVMVVAAIETHINEDRTLPPEAVQNLLRIFRNQSMMGALWRLRDRFSVVAVTGTASAAMGAGGSATLGVAMDIPLRSSDGINIEVIDDIRFSGFAFAGLTVGVSAGAAGALEMSFWDGHGSLEGSWYSGTFAAETTGLSWGLSACFSGTRIVGVTISIQGNSAAVGFKVDAPSFGFGYGWAKELGARRTVWRGVSAVRADGKVYVKYRGGPGDDHDFIGLFKKGDVPWRGVATVIFQYCDGDKEGVIEFNDPGADYVAYFCSELHEQILEGPVLIPTATSGPQLSIVDFEPLPHTGTFIVPDGRMDVRFLGGPGNDRDWVGVYYESETPGQDDSMRWEYVTEAIGSKTDGILTLEAFDTQVVYLFKDDGYDILSGPHKLNTEEYGFSFRPNPGSFQRPATPRRANTIDHNQWSRHCPHGNRWVLGNKVRYAIAFYNDHYATGFGPWSPWYNIGYAGPLLVDIPTGGADVKGRRIYRQFRSDMPGDPGTIEMVKELANNSDTQWRDEVQ
jgi:hypothetical protein